MLRLKKQVLEITVDTDFLLFGIVTAMSAVKLAWSLNGLGAFKFERHSDAECYQQDKIINFTCFNFANEENHQVLRLIAAKEEGLFLNPQLKQFDFILLVKGSTDIFNVQKFSRYIRRINEILAFNLIESEKLKEQLSYLI